MLNELNIMELAERFYNNQLTNNEWEQIQKTLQNNDALDTQWQECIALLHQLEEASALKNLKHKIDKAKELSNQKPASNIVLQFAKRHIVKIAAAAVLFGFGWGFGKIAIEQTNSKNSSKQQYMQLRREIETIKKSQTQIIDSIKENSSTLIPENNETFFGGTGFALTNDGYIVTNYHVVKDAKKIFINTAKNKNYKAYTVAFDPKSDVAILKVEDKNFTFGKKQIPYAISDASSLLGSRIYSIGFPKDDIVYNEGYVSCETGFEGDINAYQLDITANPGQSGAPILDKNGIVIGILSGKQSNTTGTTYAVRAQSINELIDKLPKANKIKLNKYSLLKNKERTEQVKLIKNYVVAVNVQ